MWQHFLNSEDSFKSSCSALIAVLCKVEIFPFFQDNYILIKGLINLSDNRMCVGEKRKLVIPPSLGKLNITYSHHISVTVVIYFCPPMRKVNMQIVNKSIINAKWNFSFCFSVMYFHLVVCNFSVY